MKRTDLHRNAHRAAKALFWLAALAALACDNKVSFSPTVPEWPPAQPGIRTLSISGNLVAVSGGCLEATVLYDGQELGNARSVCPQGLGCSALELQATVSSASGRHTISFRVLSQSQGLVEYWAQGSVVVSRPGLGLPGVRLPLGPKHVSLEAGGTVTFEVEFSD